MAGDGHHYLIHGYPVLDKPGRDDFRFSTYQVNRGAERLFEQSGFEDGDTEVMGSRLALQQCVIARPVPAYLCPNG